MERNDNWFWAAVLLPIGVSFTLNFIGISPTYVVPLEGPLVAEGATIERTNPVYYGLVFLSFVGSAVLMYADMRVFQEVKESIGKWRYLMAVSVALFYLPLIWYYWERRKVTGR